MEELILPCLLFVLSLAILIKASDFFTDSAEKIGIHFGLPPFIIGVTIVSIGTSLPELISSILAVYQDSSEIVVSNVVGSNIANIFLIIGTASVIGINKIVKINYDLVNVDLPLFVGSAFLLALEVWDRNFSVGEALILLIGYLLYLFYILKDGNGDENIKDEDDSEENPSILIEKKSSLLLGQILIVILSSIFLYLGAKYTIESLIQISEIANIGKEIIAISAVAIGTSLPELIVTVNAGMKGKADLAVGNVLGSNIFNTFVVMGVPGLLGTLTIPETVVVGGIPTMVAGTLLLFFATQDKQLTVWEGWLFFIFYGWFIGKTFNIL